MAAIVAATGDIDRRALAEALLPGLTAAGKIALAHAATGISADRKSDNSPVTAADREGQAVIIAALAELASGLPVVAEEWSGERPPAPAGKRFFLVDPLDGTRDYIAGFPDYTVNVALIENGVPEFGIILAPAMGIVFATAGKREAVRLQLPSDLALPPAGTPLPWQSIRTRPPVAGGLIALTSRSHPNPATEATLARLCVSEVRRVGSAYKLCLIASGAADLYARIGETSEWDIAAGHALLRAAGGSLVQADGRPFLYGKADTGFLNPPFMAWGSPEPFAL